MTDREIIEKWKQGLSKNKLSEIYKREYSGELICIELDNGNIIKCTPNHKIYTTNRGYIEAKNISENDNILIYK